MEHIRFLVCINRSSTCCNQYFIREMFTVHNMH